jgi:hypothetical protein
MNRYEKLIVHEAVWVLSNAFAGSSENIYSLTSLGVIDLFIEILQNTDEKVTENILWSFANMFGESTICLEEMNNDFIWSIIFESIQRLRTNVKIARVSAWLFRCVMRRPSIPPEILVA